MAEEMVSKNFIEQEIDKDLREGVYVVSEEAGLDLFDIEDVYQELTYVVDLTEKS